MKQTAVEWLEEKWNSYDLNVGKSGFGLLLKQAIEKEKQQIIDAHIDGFYSPPFGKSRNGEAKDYYDKPFKSE